MHLSFRIFGSTVREITILSTGTEWGFDNGLRVGLTRDEALAILGAGYLYTHYDLKDFSLYSSLGLSLEIINSTDLLSNINITSNALHWDLQ